MITKGNTDTGYLKFYNNTEVTFIICYDYLEEMGYLDTPIINIMEKENIPMSSENGKTKCRRYGEVLDKETVSGILSRPAKNTVILLNYDENLHD